MAAPRSIWTSCLLAGAGAGGLGLASWITTVPMLVPALAPSLLLGAALPDARENSPASVAIAHTIGLVMGLGAVAACGLVGDPPTIAGGVTLARVAAVTLALAGTLAGLVATDRLHAAAAATTLSVATGIVRPGSDVVGLALGIAWVTATIAVFPLLAARLSGGRPRPTRAAAKPRRRRR
jgi:hypothetical protein